MNARIIALPRQEPPVSPDAQEREAPARLARVASRLAALLAAERSQLILWLPVFIGIGAGVYFALPAEPPIAAIALTSLPLIGACFLLSGDARRLALLVVLSVVLGCLAGAVRTTRVAAPSLEAPHGPALVEGRVLWREPLSGSRLRILLGDVSVEGLEPAQTPTRVRLTLHMPAPGPDIGERIAVRLRLEPPGGAIAPGAFDFARRDYFEGVGASGFGGAPLRAAPSSQADPFTALRTRIHDRIARVLPPEKASLVSALITGARLGIPEADVAALRASGLAHILSISGLHLSLIAGLVFLVVRQGLALFEQAALRLPLKKIAALGALFAALFYLLISGGAVATQRSFIMIAVALLAVLFDRPAITLRSVAIAAALILLAQPESLFSPGFQMSFGAVICLVAGFEAYRRRERDESASQMSPIAVYFLGIAATSVLAEIGTAPFAAYHFNQVTSYGLIANEIALPIVSLFVMPMAALSLIAMPFGLEEWPLRLTSFGADQVLATARFVSALPGADVRIESWPGWVLPVIALGGLWTALLRTPLRWAGVPVVLLALAAASAARGPDAIIAEDGGAIALRARQDGRWVYAIEGARADSFRGEVWIARLGGKESERVPIGSLSRCDALACVLSFGEGSRMTLVRDGRVFEEACAGGGVLVSRIRPPAACDGPAALLGNGASHGLGPTAVWAGPNGIHLQSAHPSWMRRPWTQSER